jgi:ABC-type dipeptide/oligopeptide/nickel transport system permease component
MWLHPMSRGMMMMMVMVMVSHLSSLFICVLPDQPNDQLRRQHRHKEQAAHTQVKNNSKAEKKKWGKYLKIISIKRLS